MSSNENNEQDSTEISAEEMEQIRTSAKATLYVSIAMTLGTRLCYVHSQGCYLHIKECFVYIS